MSSKYIFGGQGSKCSDLPDIYEEPVIYGWRRYECHI